MNSSKTKIIFYNAKSNEGLIGAYTIYAKAFYDTICIPIDHSDITGKDAFSFLNDVFTNKLEDSISGSNYFGKFDVTDIPSFKDVEVFFVGIFPGKEILSLCSKLFKNVITFVHKANTLTALQNDSEFIQTYPERVFDNKSKTLLCFGLEQNTQVYIDTVKTTSYLSWVYANKGTHAELPDYVSLIGDFTRSTGTGLESTYFDAGVTFLFDGKFKNANRRIFRRVAYVMRCGKITYHDHLSRSRNLAKHYIPVKVVHGDRVYTMGMVNTTTEYSNTLAAYIADRLGLDIGCVYHINGRGEVSLSFRSVGSIECLFLAKAFSGDGYSQSCGARMDLEKLMSILQSRELVVPV